RHARRERRDAVGAEARPVLVARDDDGSLEVAHRHDLVTGALVLGDVDDRVLVAGLVESAVGRVALHASRLAVDRDRHGSLPARLLMLRLLTACPKTLHLGVTESSRHKNLCLTHVVSPVRTLDLGVAP